MAEPPSDIRTRGRDGARQIGDRVNTENATATAAECLRLALFGGVDEWMRLHEMCQDFTVAQTVFVLLSSAGPEHRVTVESWRQLLKELHPRLGQAQ